jgi:hypothetical protein
LNILFRYLKSIFYKNTDKPKIEYSISISLDSKYKIICESDWNKENPEIPEIAATLLYKLNGGEFSVIIINALMSHCKSNPEDTLLITNLISKWNELYKTKKEKPLIDPIEAFKQYKQYNGAKN